MDASSSLDPQQDRRKSVRFSKSNQEYVFATETPGKSAANTSGEECPARLRTDENMFRAPANSSRISVGSQRPLVSATNSNVGMLSISPGTKATVERRNAKIRRLQALQQKRDAGKVPQGSSAIRSPDLATVEKSFVETPFKTSAATAAPQSDSTIPELKFCDISSIRPSDTTFLMRTPSRASTNIVCSTPFHQPPVMGVPAAMMKSRESQASDEGSPLQPAGKISSAIKEMVLASDEDYFMSRDERADRQMEAMAVWCNMVLRSQYEEEGLDIANSKQEANKMLQDLLTKTKSGKCPSPIENKPFKYSDFLNRQKRDIMRERALQLLHSSKVPDLLRSAVENKTISIRANCSVYSEISLQTTLLRLFLSFHPAWLHLGLETVFNTTIEMRSDDVFVQVISRFIAQRLFMDPKILKNKKFAFGSGRPIVTDAGREVLHAHFLYHTALFCYFVEIAKASSIIKHNPRMFTRGSFFKSIDDVFAELSREVLSGTGMSLNKAFAKMGFKPTYKQGFADDYNYSVKTFADLTDGVILSKLVELVTECEPGFIINRLRDPCGDRLRKVGNVKTCLQVAIDKGVDVADVKPDSVVAGAKEIILKVLWKLVGIYVSVDDERNLRRASLALSSKGSDLGEVPSDATGEEIVLHVCMQVGSQLGIKVDTMCDLMDGRLLAGAWRLYNINAPDIRLYPGESLFMKVANAADSDLDIPLGLHHSIGLFAVLYLSRLFNIHELHVAASRIQKAYRSYRFFKTLRRMLESSAESQNATKPLMATYVVEAPAKPSDVSRRRSQSVEVEDGRELENALSKAREKIEGHEVTGERREQETKPSMPTAQVVKLQAIIRGFLARNRYLAMLKEKKALRDRAATVIQRFIRSFLARRCLARMRFRKVVERENAVGVRASDDVLKCDDVPELPASDDILAGQDALAAPSSNGVFESEETPAAPASNDVFFESEYVHQAAPSTSTYLPGEKPINLDRVLKLDRDLNRNEQLQKMCSNILEACERKLSEEDETASDATNHEVQVQEKPPVNELKKRKEVRIFTLEERTAAAVKIQAWYRGVRERQRLQKHLEDRREFMEAYRGNVANEEPSDVVDNVALSSRPVHSKIHDAVDMLFDPKMYVSKVGAFILNRLSALSPHLCAYLVVDAQGLSAILDIFEQKTTGRGPATAEILSILQEVFLRIVQCTHPAVVAEVEANLGDCVKIALHIFHAFYTNPVIVDGFGRAILALHRRPNAKKFFTKSKFYLNYASRRFNRLPQTDPRKTVLLEMKKEMLSS